MAVHAFSPSFCEVKVKGQVEYDLIPGYVEQPPQAT